MMFRLDKSTNIMLEKPKNTNNVSSYNHKSWMRMYNKKIKACDGVCPFCGYVVSHASYDG